MSPREPWFGDDCEKNEIQPPPIAEIIEGIIQLQEGYRFANNQVTRLVK